MAAETLDEIKKRLREAFNRALDRTEYGSTYNSERALADAAYVRAAARAAEAIVAIEREQREAKERPPVRIIEK